jgi:hypothetical protein
VPKKIAAGRGAAQRRVQRSQQSARLYAARLGHGRLYTVHPKRSAAIPDRSAGAAGGSFHALALGRLRFSLPALLKANSSPLPARSARARGIATRRTSSRRCIANRQVRAGSPVHRRHCTTDGPSVCRATPARARVLASAGHPQGRAGDQGMPISVSVSPVSVSRAASRNRFRLDAAPAAAGFFLRGCRSPRLGDPARDDVRTVFGVAQTAIRYRGFISVRCAHVPPLPARGP